MTAIAQEKQNKAGRPRSAEVHRVILDTTLELIASEGVQGTSIEAIAARAGVGKTTIYRRWKSKDDLILEALGELWFEIPFVDTGDLRQDLITMSTNLLKLQETHPLFVHLLLRIFGEAPSHPEFLQALFDKISGPRMLNITAYVERAQARGEIRPDLDPLFIVGIIGGPFVYMILGAQIFQAASNSSNPLSDQITNAFQSRSISFNDMPAQIVEALLKGIGTQRP